jgi:beta-alanine--pyruvate transaminase
MRDLDFSNNLDAFWMPFTANRQFKNAPRLLVSAKGMHYTSHDGRQILDGTAGLWCVNAGHCHPKIVEAIRAQAGELDYAPPFQMAHPKAFELSSKLVTMTPGDLNHVFFGNSGSEAVETALKIAIAYHRAKGDAGRVRLIGRERGYHGVGFGGIAVGGMVANRRQFGTLMAGVDHLPHTYDPKRQAYSRGQPDEGAEFADALERLVGLHDSSTIAAVIVEPVAGSTGVLIPPKGYLERLRAICDKHGILLIFDEVITGFGRLGAAFAAEFFGVLPDLMCVAKGITSATVPMSAVFARDFIHDALIGATPEGGIELAHGYTYSSHPLAVAASLATLDVYREEGLFERARELSPYWEDAVHSLKGARHVID